MADFLLSVGVDGDLSYDQMKADIGVLVSRLNGNPPKIKLVFDIDESDIDKTRKRLSEIANTIMSDGGSSKSNAITNIVKQAKGAASAEAAAAKSVSESYGDSVRAVKEYYSILTKLNKTSTDISLSSDGYKSTNGNFSELADALNRTKTAYDLVTNSMNGMPADKQVQLLSIITSEQIKYNLALEAQANKEREAAAATAERSRRDQESVAAKQASAAASRQAKEAASAEAAAEREQISEAKRAINEYYSILGTVKNEPDVVKSSKGFVSVSGDYKELAAAMNEVHAAYTAVRTAMAGMSEENRVGLLGRIETAERNLAIAVEKRKNAELSRSPNSSLNEDTVLKNYQTTLNGLQNAEKKWTAAKGHSNAAVRDSYKEIQNQIKELKNLGEVTKNLSGKDEERQRQLDGIKKKTDSANDAFKTSKEVIQGAGAATSSFSGRIGKLAEKFTTWFSITRVVMAAYRAVKQMVSAVIELDSAMTELKKVTNESEETYGEFLDSAATRAKKLGAKMSDTINATANFARLGYTLKEASELSDAAIIYKNVAENIDNIGDASESIISTMKAFGMETSDAMNIVDKFNEVGNNFAISSKGIGDALLNSAAAMNSANNSLDESIALITAANNVIQNPEKVGTALKTISMYLRAAKTEAEDAGESTEGMASSVSELRDELLRLTGNKVDIQIDENTFKSTYQIIKELSVVWGDIQDVSQANILELIGGKRNVNVVSALLTNFETAEEVIRTAAGAAGSALNENEKYLDSINGKITIFKSTFEDLSRTLIDSKFVKEIVDSGTKLLEVLITVSNLVECIGGLNTALKVTVGLLAVIKADSILSFISVLSKKIISLGETVALVFMEFKDGFSMAKASGASSLKSIGAGFKSVAACASTAQIAVASFLAVVTAISLVKNAIQDAEKAAISANETSADSQRKIVENSNALFAAYEEYEKYAKMTDRSEEQEKSFKGAIDLITKSIVGKTTALEGLTAGTDEYNSVLKDTIATEIWAANIAAQQERHAASKVLKGTAYSNWDGSQVGVVIGNDADAGEKKELLDYANSQMPDNVKSEYIGGYGGYGTTEYRIEPEDYDSADSIVAFYYKLISLRDELTKQGKMEGAYYDDIDSSINKLKSSTDAYVQAKYDEYAAAYKVTNGIPQTVEEYNKYKESLENIMKDSFGLSDDAASSIVSGLISSEGIYDSIIKSAEAAGYTVDESTGKITSSLSDLSESLQKLKSNYDILAKAQGEMLNGGLSAETIQTLAGETEDYLDYLYEENGIIKLNTEAWKKYSNQKMLNSINSIESEIESLKAQREELQKNLEAAEDPSGNNRDNDNRVSKATAELEENTKAIAENQKKLAIYSSLYGDITGSADAYSAALNNITDVSNTISSISASLATVADIQNTVANGFTISLEKALEFASVYPEILNGATAAADGQIMLNEGVVNSFISGKEAELKADIDSKILELEGQKSVLEATKAFSIAQLELAKNVGTGEGQISKEVAQYRVTAGNVVAKTLIENGINEATAFRLAAAAMSQNAQEFDRIAMEVCTDVDGNFNKAAYNAAQGIYNNMSNAKLDISTVAQQAQGAAKAIAGMAGGEVAGTTGIYAGSGGGVYSGGISLNLTGSSFEGTNYSYDPKSISLDDLVVDLELDISSAEQGIAVINGQISALTALRNRSLGSFSRNQGGGGGGGGGGGAPSSSGGEETWFEKQYKLHQHLLNMDEENVEDYLNWLDSAYKQAYEEGIITLDDFYKYQEEVYKGLQDLFFDYISRVEREISMRESFDGEAKNIIALYEKLMDDIEKEIAAARAQGLDDEDEYIMSLQDTWLSCRDIIKDIEGEIADNAKDAFEKLLDFQQDIIKQDIESQKDALDTKLDNLKEFYDKQKDMLQEQYDEEEYLKDQSDKRKSISDIKAQLAQLEFDDSAWAQKRKAELQEELLDAQGELDDFEKQRALELALDAVDDSYAEQESQIQKQMDALNDELNNPELIFNKALAAIQGSSENLYQQMLEFNRKYGSGNDDDVKNIYEDAYKALFEYRQLYGEDYNGVILTNETGYESENGSFDDLGIIGSEEDNQPPPTVEPQEELEPQTNNEPPLSNGSSVTIKDTATNFSSRSRNVRMASFVPGGTYTVYQTSDDEVLIGRNGVYTGWVNKSDIVGYATGTKHATAGIHTINELGDETTFESKDGARYKLFSGGEKVLNAKASDFLYEFANGGGEILEKIIKSAFGGGFYDKVKSAIVNNNFDMGGITVAGNADKATISEIRRAQKESLETMLRELNRLNK